MQHFNGTPFYCAQSGSMYLTYINSCDPSARGRILLQLHGHCTNYKKQATRKYITTRIVLFSFKLLFFFWVAFFFFFLNKKSDIRKVCLINTLGWVSNKCLNILLKNEKKNKTKQLTNQPKNRSSGKLRDLDVEEIWHVIISRFLVLPRTFFLQLRGRNFPTG